MTQIVLREEYKGKFTTHLSPVMVNSSKSNILTMIHVGVKEILCGYEIREIRELTSCSWANGERIISTAIDRFHAKLVKSQE